MRNSEDKITSAIDLYFSNLSSRKVRNHFRRHLEHNSSYVAILDWCRRYTIKVSKYVDTLKPELSREFYGDETEIARKNNKDIFWCSIDWQSRYINATPYNPSSQNMKDAMEFMHRIKQSNSHPQYIQTDALPFYPRAFKKTFYSNKEWRNPDKIKHIINNVNKTGKHNVRIETVFSKIKDRTNDFRSLKAPWSAPILMQGIILQHNFIEEHTTLRDYPCERDGLKIDLGQNRWLGLINIASWAVNAI